MPHLPLHSSVDHDGRTIWPDGSISVHPSKVVAALTQNVPIHKVFVTEITDDIVQYNKFTATPLSVKTTLSDIDPSWNIPSEFSTMDVKDYIINEKLSPEICNMPLDSQKLRITRTLNELELYESTQNIELLRVLIYIINTLTEKEVLWGVGRGSSVASYILYLIGVHDIDSVLYELDVTEFLRT